MLCIKQQRWSTGAKGNVQLNPDLQSNKQENLWHQVLFAVEGNTAELQWLEHLWDHENFETGVVLANEGW